MKTLNPPERTASDDLDIVIARSRNPVRQLLSGQRQVLLDLFDGYVNQAGWDFDSLQDLTHVHPKVRDAMRRSYSLTYRKRALSGLRKDVLGLDDGICPYCRLASSTTLDHFLPKSVHEPFAFFIHNLAPMCDTCNTLKGTKGSAKARQFFTHAYFDALPRDMRFLVAQVAVGARHIATNFVIDFSSGLDAGVYQRLAYQLLVLRLVPRYQLAAVDVIYEQAVKLDGMVADGCSAEECRVSIVGDASAQAGAYGASHWKAALLDALAANTAFCSGGFQKAL